jgi:hypothetical protein
MDPALRLQPDQEQLTPAQEAEAWRFVRAYMQRQCSTDPVDEEQATAFLCQAYQVAGLPPPARIRWVNGPREVLAAIGGRRVPGREDTGQALMWPTNVHHQVLYRPSPLSPSPQRWVSRRLWYTVEWVSLEEGILQGEKRDVGMEGEYALKEVWPLLWDTLEVRVRAMLQQSVIAYKEAPRLAYDLFWGVYLAPNAMRALASFNQLVSSYWLGTEAAVIVRRPRLLLRDEAGRLHSASGRCLEYHDGWGFYAWHGVVVPERVILMPGQLTRDDFLAEPNVEVRRVIQERMGARFVPELGGVVLDTGPRGTLYEVRLPEDDPEQVAHYVQVQDASSPRQYMLRVPPTIQTAAEAVAWSFGLSGEAYGPAWEA